MPVRKRSTPTATLADLVKLHDGYFHPLLKLTQLLCPDERIRQIANEARNCHTHLYWSSFRKEAKPNIEVGKAFDHLLRAVVDEYKMLIDTALNHIPPSASTKALAGRLAAEHLLIEIWDNPAKEQWENGFANWNKALNLALEAMYSTYEAVPKEIKATRAKIGTRRVTPKNLSDWRRLLPKVICALKPLLAAENRFRVVLRKRLDDHVVMHLELFSLLIQSLQDQDCNSEYVTLINKMVGAYRKPVIDIEKEAATTLLERISPKASTKWKREWVTRLDVLPLSIKDIAQFSKELLANIPVKAMSAQIVKLKWPDKDQPLDYSSFVSVIREIGVTGKFSTSKLQKLYTVYLLTWEVDPMGATWTVVTSLREHLAGRIPLALRQLETVKPNTKLGKEKFYDWWVRQAAEQRVDKKLSAHTGPNLRAVWFFDMLNSSTLVDSDEKKRFLFDQATVRINYLRGNSNQAKYSPPLIVNTWGDAMVAVFDDPLSAAATAISIQKIAASKGIPLRFGGAYGEIDIQVNPFLGIDAFGDTVNLAARLEPLARKNELIIDKSLGAELAKDPRFVLTKTSRTLKKPVGKLKPKTRLTCYSVRMKG